MTPFRTKGLRHRDWVKDRGRRTEARFEDACAPLLTNGRAGVHWILGIRPANDDEDREGVDYWIETDRGDIPVQLKSSREGAKVHRKISRWKGSHIPVVVGRGSHESIRDRLLLEIIPVYQEMPQPDLEEIDA